MSRFLTSAIGKWFRNGTFFLTANILETKNLTLILFYVIDNKNQYHVNRVTMSSKNQTPFKPKPALKPYSQQILERYGNPLDCLTAYLLLECSEVLARAKPANLISLVNRTRPCGRNLYQLWQQHHEELAFRIADITFEVLQTTSQALLLFCYNRNHLEQHLSHAGIRTLLHKAGYDKDASCKALVSELCLRVKKNASFPHEIGLFIGYPAKDVAAFMGLVNLPFTCQGPWKIYGNPLQSLVLAEQHLCCRKKMGAILATGNSKSLELHSSDHPFFCNHTENDYQYLGRTAAYAHNAARPQEALQSGHA